MTIGEANRQLISSLGSVYDEREASAITALVMERLSKMPRTLRLIHKTDLFNEEQVTLFRQYLEELVRHRPVQYVLGEAWFSGLPFYVDENVLIPRPETEELVDWLRNDLKTLSPPVGPVLDIGTGSGCIPVCIGKNEKDIRLLACDISPAALQIARRNSSEHLVPVDFFLCDILDISSWDPIPPLSLIISNPPYIPESQKLHMDLHVKNYEPAAALFVPDENPLLFYQAIGAFAKKKLLPGGKVFLELHHDFAGEIVKWYRENGFDVQPRKDLSGKNRMMRAQLG